MKDNKEEIKNIRINSNSNDTEKKVEDHINKKEDRYDKYPKLKGYESKNNCEIIVVEIDNEWIMIKKPDFRSITVFYKYINDGARQDMITAGDKMLTNILIDKSNAAIVDPIYRASFSLMVAQLAELKTGTMLKN